MRAGVVCFAVGLWLSMQGCIVTEVRLPPWDATSEDARDAAAVGDDGAGDGDGDGDGDGAAQDRAGDAEPADADDAPMDAALDAREPCGAGMRFCNGVCVDVGTDPGNCGECGRVCSLPNATAVCASGGCAIMRCTDGFGDCDGLPETGCEVNLAVDIAHCGRCGTACAMAFPGANATCDRGRCAMGTCREGRGDCNGGPGDGCEVDLRSDPQRCGTCSNRCLLDNATPRCVEGQCAIATCAAGFGDCNGSAVDGCETDLSMDTNHCGACGNRCPTPLGRSAVCVSRVCQVSTCTVNVGDCDANGSCETNLENSTAHCGACGSRCAPANGAGVCAGGRCGVLSCNPGFADCDRDAGNGCEVTLASDARNCNACGNACAPADATGACVGGACTVASCAVGFGNCDRNDSNGCETDVRSSAANCGGCGTRCSFPNASSSCAGGVCMLGACNTGFANCDGNAANGCETDVRSARGHCGRCGNACEVACEGGACVTPVQVTAGYAHACVRLSNGTVRCWGDNDSGQLGDGTTTDRTQPVEVSGLRAVTSISAGRKHTCAILSGGSVRCWGGNGSGEIGDGTRTDRLTPVVVTLRLSANAVAAGIDATCAVLSDGTVQCWGDYRDEQSSMPRPETVNGLSAIRGVTIGTSICAWRESGEVYCWGRGSSGPQPALISMLPPVAEVAANMSHICARTTAGRLWCWGFGGSFGVSGVHSAPIEIGGVASPTAVLTGGGHTCALHAAGRLSCWGQNQRGEVGNGSTSAQSTPAEAVPSGVTSASAGQLFTCAIIAGTVRCWGYVGVGQLGDGSTTTRTAPVTVLGLDRVRQVAISALGACALREDGTVRCWEPNGAFPAVPAPVPGLEGAVSIDGGNAHFCARTTDSVYCWGFNDRRQLGQETLHYSGRSVLVAGQVPTWRVATGGYHTCAIVGGGVRCWGDNRNGQLGVASVPEMTAVPGSVSVTSPRELSLGEFHSCALTNTTMLECWGNNHLGQLGTGEPGMLQSAPRRVLTGAAGLVLGGVSAVSLGSDFTCALRSRGVYCWGVNGQGQLGTGTTTRSTFPPATPALSDADEVSAGRVHACARVSDGTVRCWGDNPRSRLCVGRTEPAVLVPSTVTGLSGVRSIDAGPDRTCAVLNNGSVRCWGNNADGKLGDGLPIVRTTPVTVRF